MRKEKEDARIFREYLENEVSTQWDSDLLDFLMQVSVVGSFTISLAEMITGDPQAEQMLRRACAAGNFLFQEEDVYRFRPLLKETLAQRAQRLYGRRVSECQYNAGLYYEMHGQPPKALAMYSQSGHTDRIRAFLISNARRNPGNGCYYELRAYDLRLREEDILGNVVLMAGMSMLYSLLQRICRYRFVRLISEEGAAILPLLERARREWIPTDTLDKTWFKKVLEETRQLSLSVERVRYHNKQNHKKLGVSGKAEAVLAARNLKLL